MDRACALLTQTSIASQRQSFAVQYVGTFLPASNARPLFGTPGKAPRGSSHKLRKHLDDFKCACLRASETTAHGARAGMPTVGRHQTIGSDLAWIAPARRVSGDLADLVRLCAAEGLSCHAGRSTPDH